MSLKVKSNRDKKKCADKIRKSHTKYENGKISLEKFIKIITDCGIDSEYWTLKEQQNLTNFLNQNKKFVESQYAEGDNSNREKGSTYNPYHTVKGKIFHTTVKQSIRKAIDLAEWLILYKYDKDAFVYDDRRLKSIDDLLRQYIDDKFQHREYKVKLMHQIRNIFCVMIKEDPYYTSVAYDFMNLFIETYIDGFELTESEQFNLDNYHVGTQKEIDNRIRELRESLKRQKP